MDINRDSMLNKWAAATINLDLEYSLDQEKRRLRTLFGEKKISDIEYKSQIEPLLYNAPKISGTAIFLKYKQALSINGQACYL